MPLGPNVESRLGTASSNVTSSTGYLEKEDLRLPTPGNQSKSKRIEKATRQIQKLQKDVTSMLSSTREAKDDLDKLVNQTNQLLHETKAAEAKVLDLQKEQVLVKDEAEKIQKQHNQLLQEKESLEAQLETLRQENAVLENYLKEAQVN